MEKELRENWDKILEHMRTQFSISNVIFRTFIQNLSVYSVTPSIRGDEDDLLTIAIDDSQVGDSKKYIEDKFSVYLAVSIEEITAIHYELSFINLSEANLEKEEKSSEDLISYERPYNPTLNKDYTFDTFIVGDNNNFAQAASLKVADEPGVSFNPLFIYGGSGLGKTHLMHAIANYILDHKPSMRVVYVTSETFTNEIVEALRSSRNGSPQPLKDFRQKYRENVDVLLIDDIQFIIGKDSTQSEFFHSFNDLTSNKKQVIISSDKPPAEMTTLDERYRSRFEMGITVDVKPPTYETRLAILRSKVANQNIIIDDEILAYIADNIISNIRELEGAINQVITYSKLCGKSITMESAKEALSDKINPNAKRAITIDYILEIVADHFGITINDIISKKRSNNIAYPRHICMYLCRTMTGSSFSEIGNKIGARDHSTAMHGNEKIEDLLKENDTNTIQNIDILKKKIDPQ